MRIAEYKTEQLLPINITNAWSFFSSPRNLVLITPAALDFKILTMLDGKEIYSGMIIDYLVKPLWGIRLGWKTEICEIDKPFSFTDRQVKGPYKLWEHKHLFIEKENGVLIKDEVKYQLPLGVIGMISHSLIVRKKIENIFDYRKLALDELFKKNEYC